MLGPREKARRTSQLWRSAPNCCLSKIILSEQAQVLSALVSNGAREAQVHGSASELREGIDPA